MSRKSLTVVLSEAEIVRLEQWIRAGSTPQQVVLRARIILATTQGSQDMQIAERLQVHRFTVALWRRRVREEGIGCVWEIESGRGRKPRYGAADTARILKATLHSKPKGATHWSTRTLAEAQKVSKNTIHRLWQEHQLKPHLSKSFKLSRDPKFLEKLNDVVGVYLTPPQNAVVLCVDEKSQIQALDRTQPGLPLKPGRWREGDREIVAQNVFGWVKMGEVRKPQLAALMITVHNSSSIRLSPSLVPNYPFIYGRGLDSRPGKMGGGAMEIGTVPRFDATDAQGTTYTKLPKLQFPVDAEGRAFLVQDVTYYSKTALYNAFKSWRDGGPACSGRIDGKGAFKPKLNTRTTHYDQAGKKITGVESAFDTRIFEGNVWGLQWFANGIVVKGLFPQYYKQVGEERVAVPAAAVPAETKLLAQEFKHAGKGAPYTSPSVGAWATPGPKLGPLTAWLVDGSVVTYSWYRFVDQPSFQQYHWSAEKKAKLQALVEKLHAHWTLDRDYMAPPTLGKLVALVALDPALLVTPPKGLEVGYVPIVTRQLMP